MLQFALNNTNGAISFNFTIRWGFCGLLAMLVTSTAPTTHGREPHKAKKFDLHKHIGPLSARSQVGVGYLQKICQDLPEKWQSPK